MNRHLADGLERIYKMPEQFNGMFTFSVKEVVKHLVTARMRLVGLNEFLFAVRARPHGSVNLCKFTA